MTILLNFKSFSNNISLVSKLKGSLNGLKFILNFLGEIISSLGLKIPVAGLKKDNHHSTNALLFFDPIIEIPIDKKSNLFYLLGF